MTLMNMERMEPEISRSSQFVERWSRAEYMNGKLTLILISVAGISVILTGALVYSALKPRPVYYISGSLDAGIALPQSVSGQTTIAFVSSWLLNWTNFTPATVSDVYLRAKRFMSPALLGRIQARLQKDLEQIKRDNISSMFSLTQEPTVSLEKAGFNVIIHGESGIFMGKDEIKVQKMIYNVQVRKVNPTDNNPYGLMIEAIDQESMT